MFPVKNYDEQLLNRVENESGQPLSTIAANNELVGKVLANYKKIQVLLYMLFLNITYHIYALQYNIN